MVSEKSRSLFDSIVFELFIRPRAERDASKLNGLWIANWPLFFLGLLFVLGSLVSPFFLSTISNFYVFAILAFVLGFVLIELTLWYNATNVWEFFFGLWYNFQGWYDVGRLIESVQYRRLFVVSFFVPFGLLSLAGSYISYVNGRVLLSLGMAVLGLILLYVSYDAHKKFAKDGIGRLL